MIRGWKIRQWAGEGNETGITGRGMSKISHVEKEYAQTGVCAVRIFINMVNICVDEQTEVKLP